MLNRSSTCQKINFKCTFCGFSFTPISKWLENVHETFINTKHSLLKTYFSLIIECGIYLKCLQKRVNLAALLIQNKPSAPIRRVENKVEFFERQFQSEKLSFVHKRKLSILLNFLFPFVSFIGVFSILKCKTFVSETTTSWSRASHFVDRWHLQRCQIRFFPRPLNGWHDHWTFVGFTDLVWEFFPKLLCN